MEHGVGDREQGVGGREEIFWGVLQDIYFFCIFGD